MSRLTKRFIDYVKIDTQSDPNSSQTPSTEKQKDLSKLLVKELTQMGYEAILDEYGYVYTKVLSNTTNKVQALGLVAHVDTSFDASGTNVTPRIIKAYNGSEIVLNDNLKMSPKTDPVLNKVIGDDIIVTNGHTLLGADDKAGVAIIMEFLEFLSENNNFKHGDLYICFTPDEEIGRGADLINYELFKPNFAYTLDGSEVGEIEYENFNAASVNITFLGKSIHPGSSKGQMINSQHLAFEFHQMLPKFLNPAYTEGYEGFNHLTNIIGEVEKTISKYIIRNHDIKLFNQQKADFKTITNYLNNKYGYNAVNLEIKDSYFNMYEKIKERMDIIELAKDAIESVGLKPITNPIRGGTDGAKMTYDGMLTPNLGTGSFNFHGPREFASINQMHQALEVVKAIVTKLTQK